MCLQVLHSNLEKHVLPYMSDSPSAVPDPTSVGTAMSDAMGDQLVAPELGLLSGGGQAVVKCQVKDCTKNAVKARFVESLFHIGM